MADPTNAAREFSVESFHNDDQRFPATGEDPDGEQQEILLNRAGEVLTEATTPNLVELAKERNSLLRRIVFGMEMFLKTKIPDPAADRNGRAGR